MYLQKFTYYFLNNEEKEFIKTSRVYKTKTNSISLVQCPQDIEYLKVFEKIINNSDNNFQGILPNYTYCKFWQFILFFPFKIKQLHHYLQQRKWNNLFSKLGILKFYKSNELNFINKLKCFKQALIFYFKIKDKRFLLNHVYDKIKCGDLIYDSFLRFNNVPTINLKNPTLLLYIYDCYCQIFYFKSLVAKNKFISYYTTYSSYISHGIPVRVFLNANIKVYSIILKNDNDYTVKELSVSDNLHTKSHWNYKSNFQKLNHSELRKLGYEKFAKRFIGNNDLSYMKVNPFKKSNLNSEALKNIDGVIFLHDFVDSPHGFRNMVFEDFYEWTIATLNYLKQSNYKVAIKPHPNQKDASSKFVSRLKLNYPDFLWISEDTSNILIFNSGIKFGISVYGTVLAELAFHKITPICCGDNPASSYDFIFEAKNADEYFKFIENHNNLKFNENLKDQLGEYYYMNYMHN